METDPFLANLTCSAVNPFRSESKAFRTELHVVGSKDNRKPSSKRQVVHIRTFIQEELQGVGSGFFIQDLNKTEAKLPTDYNFAMTAAHVVTYFDDGLKVFDSFEVAMLKEDSQIEQKFKDEEINYYDLLQEYDIFTVGKESVSVFPRYAGSPFHGTDFALIRIPKHVTFLPEFYAEVLKKTMPTVFQVYGFPGEIERLGRQYCSADAVAIEEENNLRDLNNISSTRNCAFAGFKRYYDTKKFTLARYLNQTSAGMSGGPLIFALQSVVGVHVMGGLNDVQGGSFFTEKVFQWVKNIQMEFDVLDLDFYSAIRSGNIEVVRENLAFHDCANKKDKFGVLRILSKYSGRKESNKVILL